jgi:hypothetical protein
VSMLPRQTPSFLIMRVLICFFAVHQRSTYSALQSGFQGLEQALQCVGGSDGGKDSCLGVGMCRARSCCWCRE